MVFVYNGVKVNYKVYGKSMVMPCLLLHGWGCNGNIFSDLISKFPDRTFITLDFPPFGKSGKINADWNIFIYASMVMSLCEHLRISKCDIVGHSFGGRVAILLASLKKAMVNSCVLVDSAGLKPKRGFKYYYKLYKYKICRKFGFYVKDAGSEDYKNLSPEMKKVFVAIVNQYLDEYAAIISARTLIVFGKNDADTPVYMAKKLNKLIKNSQLVLLEEAGHFCFLDSPMLFYKTIEEFWEGL